nr:hypothetical protein [Tanacetum cinerariifolium]
MGLFSFIHHANPTKVIVGKIEKAGDQVSLLEATHGRVVPLAPLVPVTAASSEGDMTQNIDMLFDEGNSVEKACFTGGGEYVVLTEAIVEPMNEDAAEKPRRDDYGTSGASASTGGKSHVVMQNLLDSSKLDAEIRVTATATVPLITSSVTPTSKRKGGDLANSVSSPNLLTKPAAVRFVISLDSSYHSGTHVVDVEVSSLVRSNILDTSVMTAAVATTAVGTSLVSLSKVTVKPVNRTLFGYSMSTSRDDVARPSISIHPELFADSFYAIQDLNPEILYREVKAAEAIRLHGRVAIVEAAKALHAAELNLLKERNYTLEAKMRASEAKDMALKSKKNSLTDQVSSLETTCAELRNQVVGYEIFKEQIEVVQDEEVRVHTEKIAEVDASLMGMALQLDDDFYLRYLTTIKGQRWILSLDKGMQDGLAAGIKHEKIGWALSDVVARNPSTDVNYVAVVSALRNVDFSLLTLLESQKDASIADIMDSIGLKGPAAEISGAGKGLGDAKARRLPLFDAMVPLIEPLSYENLLGEASTSGVPVTADAVTTLSTTFAQSVLVLAPLQSVADHGVVNVGPHVDDPSYGGIVFEKEELKTSHEPDVGS